MRVIKPLICFAVFLIGLTGRAQQLSLSETIDYINQAISNERKLSLSTDGMITYSGISYTKKPFAYTVHISELRLPREVEQPMFSNIDGKNPWQINLWCKGAKRNFDGSNSTIPCIQETSGDSRSNSSYFSLTTKGEDKYSTEKLLNAVSYLFALAKENGMDVRADNDPFAPNNYNPNAVEVKSTSKNGSIRLSMQNGVYHIMVTIGGITKSFVLDSGASEVLISQEYERALIANGTLRKENYLTPALYRIADGSIVQCKRVVIPKLTIAGFTISNVQASIGVGSVSLLLGKTVLDKFSSWTINNQTQTLNIEK